MGLKLRRLTGTQVADVDVALANPYFPLVIDVKVECDRRNLLVPCVLGNGVDNILVPVSQRREFFEFAKAEPYDWGSGLRPVYDLCRLILSAAQPAEEKHKTQDSNSFHRIWL